MSVDTKKAPTSIPVVDRDGEGRICICIASIHSHFDLDRATQTRRVIGAVQNPSVRMIGHLTTVHHRSPLADRFRSDVRVRRCARQRHVLEVNGALPRLDPPLEVLRAAQARDVTFLLTSDAHHTKVLALIDFAARYAHRGHLAPESVANSWPAERLLAWLAEGR